MDDESLEIRTNSREVSWPRLLHSQTSSHDNGSAKPEEWPRLFEKHFNANDLDAVMALYEPEAGIRDSVWRFTVVGRNAIRNVLRGMIDSKTRLHSRVIRAVTVGDIAQLYTDFEGTTVE